MRIWSPSWNWKIVAAASLLGGVAGAVVGAQRSAALLQHGALPVNSVEVHVASDSDGWVFTLLYAILGASVALTILAPPLVVATLFQVREMSRQARLKSHRAMQQAFPGAAPPGGAAADSESEAIGWQAGKPS